MQNVIVINSIYSEDGKYKEPKTIMLFHDVTSDEIYKLNEND